MVEMKYTKFVLSAIKERIFGKPDPNTEITIKGKKIRKKVKLTTVQYLEKSSKKRKSDAIKWPRIRMKNISSISGIIMPIIMIIVGFTIFGIISSALNTTALGASSSGIMNIMNLVPFVLVVSVVIGILTTILKIFIE